MYLSSVKSVTVTLTPNGATSDVDFVSSNTAVFTVTKVSNTSATVVPVAAGTATLTATTDNGLSDDVTVTVTAS